MSDGPRTRRAPGIKDAANDALDDALEESRDAELEAADVSPRPSAAPKARRKATPTPPPAISVSDVAPRPRNSKTPGPPKSVRAGAMPGGAKTADRVSVAPSRRSQKPPKVEEKVETSERVSRAPRGKTPAPTRSEPKGRESRAPVKTAPVRPAAKEPKEAKDTRRNRKLPADTGLNPHSENFFAEGEEAASVSHAPLGLGHESDVAGLPAAIPPERKRAIMRTVMIAVGVCAVLCLAALARMALAHDDALPSHATAPIAEPAVPPIPAPEATALAPAPAETAAAPNPAASATPPAASAGAAASAAVAVAAPGAPTASAAPATSAAAVDPNAPPAKTAAQEKDDARRLLERGKLQDAIDAAERSTALDPTDADAWLLQGAAYLEKGKSVDARAAFSSCLKEAKKGPISECRSMLR